jgi:hypothetical protein
MAGLVPFHESHFMATPIRDLGLAIPGTPLEPVVEEFMKELAQVGINRLKPDFYLSTEWGVVFPSVSIGIPFYLAKPELTAVHAEHIGHLEGEGRADLLRYLRHEMGHVVNYAYRLYEQEEWIKRFGSMTQPYLEEYRPEPFSRRYVWHLPGWYAQKHPDEDWAETFAVWMTPHLDWRSAYKGWPQALAKLEYCDRTMAIVKEQDPIVATAEQDEAVSTLTASLEKYYQPSPSEASEQLPPGLDGALRAIFEDYSAPDQGEPGAKHLPADELIRRMERSLVANVYRWTGHFPELTRPLLKRLAEHAREMHLVYPKNRETSVAIALTTLVTALAMNHVFRGSYTP